MPIKNPLLRNVFIALRPNFFPGYHKEHITLKYYDEVAWNYLIRDCSRLEKQLPAEIHPLQYSTWPSGNRYFCGLLVDAPGGTVLDHLSMPHITLPNDMYMEAPFITQLNPQVVDTLWIGKSINGRYIWAKFDSRSIYGDYPGIEPRREAVSGPTA